MHTESNSVAEGRSVGSFVRQRVTKSTKVVDHILGLEIEGGGKLGIAEIPSILRNPRCGARPSASSISVIPNDHVSALKS